ncbi:MAG: AMP-binding protein [Gammaproteobacteria bacterium]|nr:AMP-binding protein [Gammaproteobacteria bacterium]
MTLLERITWHAAQRPDAGALSWPGGTLGYASLLASVEDAMAALSQRNVRVLALDLDNGPDWVVLDIAAMALGLCVIPLPAFFSPAQLQHALHSAGVEAVITDAPSRLRMRAADSLAASETPFDVGSSALHWVATSADIGRVAIPTGVDKITFTSGTTGAPKGVMLGWRQMRAVAISLVEAVRLTPLDVHLALMPLAVLLENIAGVYAPLWAGARVQLQPLAQVGMRGAAGVDGAQMCAALRASCATTAIFTPQTLQALVEARELEPASAAPLALRFAAVGGAPVSPRLLQRATAVGLPVYEGYGLSECGSVVCLNTPQANRPGSVGRPLPHVTLQITDDGEVVIEPLGFIAYLGEPPVAVNRWHSGDIGACDADGYLYLQGRRRNVFITAFGRNVAPEWVERELTLEPVIVQAAVFGEARPFNVAVLVVRDDSSAHELSAALARVNRELPDYARVARWVIADAPFSVANGCLTGTGRVRREAVLAQYGDAIESLYLETQSL